MYFSFQFIFSPKWKLIWEKQTNKEQKKIQKKSYLMKSDHRLIMYSHHRETRSITKQKLSKESQEHSTNLFVLKHILHCQIHFKKTDISNKLNKDCLI